MLAGCAGLLIAPLFSVHSDMGTLFGLKAFAVAILGGMTSASGVMLAGFLFGLTEALVTAYLGSSSTYIVVFALVILALTMKPDGLFGRPRSRKFKGIGMSFSGNRLALDILILSVTVAGIAAALASGGYTQFVIGLVALTTILGAGLNVLFGLTGLVSLGQVGFFAIGAYACGIATLSGISFWLALPVSAGIAGIAGGLLAVPAVRMAGPFLAMVTIAFAFIVEHGAVEWRTMTGGQNGLMGFPCLRLAVTSYPSGILYCSQSCWPDFRSTCSVASPTAVGAWL